MRGQKFWWISAFVLGALTFYYVEGIYKQSKRKNPLDYLYEVDPNAPIVCRRGVDVVPGGSRPDTPVDAKTVCDPNPPPPEPTKKDSKTKAKK